MKDAYIHIRITQGQKEVLTAKAEAAGLNLSEYVRILVLRDLEIIK